MISIVLSLRQVVFPIISPLREGLQPFEIQNAVDAKDHPWVWSARVWNRRSTVDYEDIHSTR